SCHACGQKTTTRICPKCHSELPYTVGEYDDLIFAIVGAPDAGKSHYIAVLIETIKTQLSEDFHCALHPINDKTIQRYREDFYNPIFRKHEVLMKTRSARADRNVKKPLIYTLSFTERWLFRQHIKAVVTLVFFDAAGEDLNAEDTMRTENKYIYNSAGIILLFDPLQLPELQAKLPADTALPLDSTEAEDILVRVSNLIRQAKRLKQTQLINIPIAVAFSKMDAVEPILDSSSALKYSSKHEGHFNLGEFKSVNSEMEALVKEWTSGSFIPILNSNFKQHAFFGLTALGSNPHGTNKIEKLRPNRVEDPFLWLLWQNHLINDETFKSKVLVRLYSILKRWPLTLLFIMLLLLGIIFNTLSSSSTTTPTIQSHQSTDNASKIVKNTPTDNGEMSTLPNFSTERDTFKQIYHKLQQGNYPSLQTLEKDTSDISNYPITDYLSYFYLINNFSTVSTQEINTFLTNHPHFRQNLLLELAKSGSWKKFLKTHQYQSNNDNNKLRCYYLNAQIKTKGRLDTQEQDMFKDLWRVGRSQPNSCDPVFEWASQKKLLTKDLFAQRLDSTIQEGRLALGNYLTNNSKQYNFQSFKNNKFWKIVAQAKRHQTNNAAYTAWQSNFSGYNNRKSNELLAYIAMNSHWQKQDDTINRLQEVNFNHLSSRTQERMTQVLFQALLEQQNWSALHDFIKGLPSEIYQHHHAQWEYWKARSLEKMDNSQKAKDIYKQLATELTYYGFLAAQHLGKHYSLSINRIHVSSEQKKALMLRRQELLRIREAYLLDLQDYAQQEWHHKVPQLASEEQVIMVVLAKKWQWYNAAIRTSEKLNLTDFNLLYPTPFQKIIRQKSLISNINWIYAVMREESHFNKTAVSIRGAKGLMQLMESTAQERANKLNIQLEDGDIFKIDVNIKLGTAHLKYLLQ
ncbi:MAG: transglycosylase SLT domain-containing protein, partial [Thiotrichaceae bacterium]|nr:transglycosylase SLT domain-containing protein [Thiotrichaceae bacterium]